MFIQKRLSNYEFEYHFNFDKWEKLQDLVHSFFPDIVLFQEVNKWYFMPQFIPNLKHYVNETNDQLPMYDNYLKCMIFVKNIYCNQITRINFPRHIYSNHSNYNPLIHTKENHHWSIWIKFAFEYGTISKTFIIQDLYQSPNRSIDKYNDVLNNQAELQFIKSHYKYDYIINGGDYNLKHNHYNLHKKLHLSAAEQQAIDIWDDYLNIYDLQILNVNGIPTTRYGYVVDYMAASVSLLKKPYNCFIINNEVSDHQGILFHTQLYQSNTTNAADTPDPYAQFKVDKKRYNYYKPNDLDEFKRVVNARKDELYTELSQMKNRKVPHNDINNI